MYCATLLALVIQSKTLLWRKTDFFKKERKERKNTSFNHIALLIFCLLTCFTISMASSNRETTSMLFFHTNSGVGTTISCAHIMLHVGTIIVSLCLGSVIHMLHSKQIPSVYDVLGLFCKLNPGSVIHMETSTQGETYSSGYTYHENSLIQRSTLYDLAHIDMFHLECQTRQWEKHHQINAAMGWGRIQIGATVLRKRVSTFSLHNSPVQTSYPKATIFPNR